MSTFDEHSLQIFYSRLFPYELMFEWLSYGHDQQNNSDSDKDFFFHREFSFTKANDVYIRYLSFKDALEFKERVKLDQPHKIDIGAVYSYPAKDHTAVPQSKFRPTHRELVFDVDLTDYEEVSTNDPKGPLWAKKAWLFMACAIKVVDACLREDFGFNNLLWVFSGRRGVHCWVCDDSALVLEDYERQAIVDYLTIITSAGKGNESLDQRIRLSAPYHPSMKRAIEICTPFFKSCCISEDKGQGILSTPERWNKVLGMIPNFEGIRERLSNDWLENPASAERKWAMIETTVKTTAKTLNANFREQLLKSLDSIILFHMYPRLDVNVSTHRNHLLKSPFVVHPKTGCVCVPIFDVQSCENFDPENVPNLKTLVQELELARESTSLAPFLDRFKTQFIGSLKKQQKLKLKDSKEQVAAFVGDW